MYAIRSYYERLRRILVLGEGTQQLFVYAKNGADSPRIKAEVFV